MPSTQKKSCSVAQVSDLPRQTSGLRYLTFALTSVALWAAWPQPSVHWAGPQVTLLGAPSPDGEWISFADPVSGALALRNLRSGVIRDIAHRPLGAGREFAYFSSFSRDGSAVAYAWFNSDGFYELRLTGVDGKDSARTIYRNEQAGFVQPCSWTPDNKQILTLLFRKDNTSQIALIPRDGGAPRVLRSLNWVYPKRMDVSPDGRWVVYDNFAAEGKPERALFLLSMDGSRESRITGLPANALFPFWSPDGRSVFFAGDSGGEQQIWRVAVADGETRGKAEPVSLPLGRILLLGIGGENRMFFGSRAGAPDVFVTGNGVPKRIETRWAGRNSAPAWSVDGKRLAYLSRRGTENFGQQAHSIVIQNMDSGEEREIDPRMAHIERLAWSPDGALLLAAGSDGKGRAGLFTVRLKDGATVPFAAAHDGPFRGYEAVWAHDGNSVYYLRGGAELVERKLADGAERVVLQVAGLDHLAIAPEDDTLAVGMGGVAIRITPLAPGAQARVVSFPGLSDLAWGRQLLAGRGTEVWQVPLDGSAARRLMQPEGRVAGLSVSTDGRIAITIGSEQNRILSLALP